MCGIYLMCVLVWEVLAGWREVGGCVFVCWSGGGWAGGGGRCVVVGDG